MDNYEQSLKKIVELLNKYEKERIINKWWSVDEEDNYFWRSVEDWKIVNRDYDPDAHSFMQEYITSRRFEFIKWLVERGYINVYKIHDVVLHSGRLYHWKDKTTADRVNENYVDLLTMFLSIQDNPIQFLIDILA